MDMECRDEKKASESLKLALLVIASSLPDVVLKPNSNPLQEQLVL